MTQIGAALGCLQPSLSPWFGYRAPLECQPTFRRKMAARLLTEQIRPIVGGRKYPFWSYLREIYFYSEEPKCGRNMNVRGEKSNRRVSSIWVSSIWGGKEKEREIKKKKSSEIWVRKSCQNRKPSTLSVCVPEGSLICNPVSWVPPFSSRVTFPLVFTGRAFPLVGGGPGARAGHFPSCFPVKAQSIRALGLERV